MTSGMSAKGGALRSGVPESGVPSNRAPTPRAAGPSDNGTRSGRRAKADADSQEADRNQGGQGGQRDQEAQGDQARQGSGAVEGTSATGTTAESVLPTLPSSVRTLILGIDYDGRIVPHRDESGGGVRSKEGSG